MVRLKSIQGYINQIWNEIGAWPEIVQAMRFALNALNGENDNREWALLPGLCCQAAGGAPDVALPIAAAWLLFYAAAKVMDDVEDRDDPDVWWAEIGSRGAISAATGLYFTASLLLSRLDLWLEDQEAAREIRSGMLSRFMEMCSGQHLDLMVEKPNLEEYQRIAAAKSGTFFSMACWAGARLATNELKILDGFQQYGKQMGLLVQLSDDLMDFKRLKADPEAQKINNLIRSFPVVSVLETCSEPEKKAILQSTAA